MDTDGSDTEDTQTPQDGDAQAEQDGDINVQQEQNPIVINAAVAKVRYLFFVNLLFERYSIPYEAKEPDNGTSAEDKVKFYTAQTKFVRHLINVEKERERQKTTEEKIEDVIVLINRLRDKLGESYLDANGLSDYPMDNNLNTYKIYLANLKRAEKEKWSKQSTENKKMAKLQVQKQKLDAVILKVQNVQTEIDNMIPNSNPLPDVLFEFVNGWDGHSLDQQLLLYANALSFCNNLVIEKREEAKAVAAKIKKEQQQAKDAATKQAKAMAAELRKKRQQEKAAQAEQAKAVAAEQRKEQQQAKAVQAELKRQAQEAEKKATLEQKEQAEINGLEYRIQQKEARYYELLYEFKTLTRNEDDLMTPSFNSPHLPFSVDWYKDYLKYRDEQVKELNSRIKESKNEIQQAKAAEMKQQLLEDNVRQAEHDHDNLLNDLETLTGDTEMRPVFDPKPNISLQQWYTSYLEYLKREIGALKSRINEEKTEARLFKQDKIKEKKEVAKRTKRELKITELEREVGILDDDDKRAIPEDIDELDQLDLKIELLKVKKKTNVTNLMAIDYDKTKDDTNDEAIETIIEEWPEGFGMPNSYPGQSKSEYLETLKKARAVVSELQKESNQAEKHSEQTRVDLIKTKSQTILGLTLTQRTVYGVEQELRAKYITRFLESVLALWPSQTEYITALKNARNDIKTELKTQINDENVVIKTIVNNLKSAEKLDTKRQALTEKREEIDAIINSIRTKIEKVRDNRNEIIAEFNAAKQNVEKTGKGEAKYKDIDDLKSKLDANEIKFSQNLLILEEKLKMANLKRSNLDKLFQIIEDKDAKSTAAAANLEELKPVIKQKIDALEKKYAKASDTLNAALELKAQKNDIAKYERMIRHNIERDPDNEQIKTKLQSMWTNLQYKIRENLPSGGVTLMWEPMNTIRELFYALCVAHQAFLTVAFDEDGYIMRHYLTIAQAQVSKMKQDRNFFETVSDFEGMDVREDDETVPDTTDKYVSMYFTEDTDPREFFSWLIFDVVPQLDKKKKIRDPALCAKLWENLVIDDEFLLDKYGRILPRKSVPWPLDDDPEWNKLSTIKNARIIKELLAEEVKKNQDDAEDVYDAWSFNPRNENVWKVDGCIYRIVEFLRTSVSLSVVYDNAETKKRAKAFKDRALKELKLSPEQIAVFSKKTTYESQKAYLEGQSPKGYNDFIRNFKLMWPDSEEMIAPDNDYCYCAWTETDNELNVSGLKALDTAYYQELNSMASIDNSKLVIYNDNVFITEKDAQALFADCKDTFIVLTMHDIKQNVRLSPELSRRIQDLKLEYNKRDEFAAPFVRNGYTIYRDRKGYPADGDNDINTQTDAIKVENNDDGGILVTRYRLRPNELYSFRWKNKPSQRKVEASITSATTMTVPTLASRCIALRLLESFEQSPLGIFLSGMYGEANSALSYIIAALQQTNEGYIMFQNKQDPDYPEFYDDIPLPEFQLEDYNERATWHMHVLPLSSVSDFVQRFITGTVNIYNMYNDGMYLNATLTQEMHIEHFKPLPNVLEFSSDVTHIVSELTLSDRNRDGDDDSSL